MLFNSVLSMISLLFKGFEWVGTRENENTVYLLIFISGENEIRKAKI